MLDNRVEAEAPPEMHVMVNMTMRDNPLGS